MPIDRIDHFTVLSADAIAAAEFFSAILGLESGPRPHFCVAGVWLYCNDAPILHIIERENVATVRGSMDHIALWGRDLSGTVARLKARGTAFRLQRIPAGGPSEGDWQLYFETPDGAHIEIGFSGAESPPRTTC